MYNLYRLLFIGYCLSVIGCSGPTRQFETEVLLPFTPVKNQGGSQLCWAYAMLSAIETEHIVRGDSVHLSVAYLERMMEQEADAPSSKRGMGITAVHLMEKYGMVPYDAMPSNNLRSPSSSSTQGAQTSSLVPIPKKAFMEGMEYTPQEFARSVCAPGEYIGLGTDDSQPYYEEYEPALPDNWEHNRLMNLPSDSLLALTVRAIEGGRGVCWEGDISERGFDREKCVADIGPDYSLFNVHNSIYSGSTTDDHCMAIVGIAHDEDGNRYFIMKNSWGRYGPYAGMVYLSFNYFREKTIAVFMPHNIP